MPAQPLARADKKPPAEDWAGFALDETQSTSRANRSNPANATRNAGGYVGFGSMGRAKRERGAWSTVLSPRRWPVSFNRAAALLGKPAVAPGEMAESDNRSRTSHRLTVTGRLPRERNHFGDHRPVIFG